MKIKHNEINTKWIAISSLNCNHWTMFYAQIETTTLATCILELAEIVICTNEFLDIYQRWNFIGKSMLSSRHLDFYVCCYPRFNVRFGNKKKMSKRFATHADTLSFSISTLLQLKASLAPLRKYVTFNIFWIQLLLPSDIYKENKQYFWFQFGKGNSFQLNTSQTVFIYIFYIRS